MTQSANSAPKASPAQSSGRSPWLLILIFRLLLLGVGGGLAIILGIVLAHFSPNPSPEKPLLLKIMERLDGFENKTVITPVNSGSQPALDTGQQPVQLTAVERQQLQAELKQLQAQQQRLKEGIAYLEAHLDIERPNADLEERLRTISHQLQEEQSANINFPSNLTSASRISGSTGVLAPDGKWKSTLPSDLLFEKDNSILHQDAGLILNEIVADLRGLQGSTILIAAYTDNTGEANYNRQLSFNQAKAVEQYLARTLGDSYHWLAVGYGETQPLATNDSDTQKQRNRRIEIVVN